STPSTRAQIPASNSSAGVDGATYASPSAGRVPPGAGKAAWSTFPAGVSGRPASSVNTDGTMNSGSRPAKNARSSPTGGTPAAGSAGTRQPTSRSAPPSAITTAWATPG